MIKAEMLSNLNRLLGATNLFENHEGMLPGIGNGLIFTTSFSLIWVKQNVFLFDLHSRSKDGLFIACVSSIFLAFKSLSDVENYIKSEYTNNTNRQLHHHPCVQKLIVISLFYAVNMNSCTKNVLKAIHTA